MSAQIRFKTFIKLHKFDKLKRILNVYTLKWGLHLNIFDPSRFLVDLS